MVQFLKFRIKNLEFSVEDRVRALDLHVLGAPLAFILSQDQTLHKKVFEIVSQYKY